jgi:hypothetical protein
MEENSISANAKNNMILLRAGAVEWACMPHGSVPGLGFNAFKIS